MKSCCNGVRSWRFTNGVADKDGFSVFIDNVLISSGLTWLQATEFCKGRSLADLKVFELSLF